MSQDKKYWKGFEDLNPDGNYKKLIHKEFPEELPVDKFLSDNNLENTQTHRRDFLKFLGFSVTAVSLASCEAPITKSIPYLVKPEEITPGVANWYASAYYDGYDYCDVIVKTREGRPIKVEGNKLSSLTKGGVNARVQASVLSLYDSARLKGPLAKGEPSDWETVDRSVKNKLVSIAAAGGNIRILSSSVISPSSKELITDFIKKYPSAKHVTYDPVSYWAMVKANESTFDKALIPSYHFDKAQVIVSFGADFLDNWLSPLEFAADYIVNRKVDEKKSMSRHIQFETIMTVTGSNADVRVALKPSQMAAAAVNLYNHLAKLTGNRELLGSSDLDSQTEELAKELLKNKGKALVVCGINDTAMQIVVNEINKLLDSYSGTIDLDNPMYLKQGADYHVAELAEEMNRGEIGALFIWNCNPVYSLPSSMKFSEGLKNVALKVSFADRSDETAQMADFVCPDHHPYESWNDASAKRGYYTVSQPSITPVFKTRQAQDSLLKWIGETDSYYSYIRKYWEKNIFPLQNKFSLFDSFWNQTVHDGVYEVKDSSRIPVQYFKTDGKKMSVSVAAEKIASIKATDKTELLVFENTAMGCGFHSNNPWLQELPDPITKVTWDNYFTMSPSQMKEMGLNMKQGQEELSDVIEVSINGNSIKAPVVPVPGQALGTVGIALGYGRKGAGKAADGLGANAFALTSFDDTLKFEQFEVNISGSIDKQNIAATQTHHTMMGRNIVKESTLATYLENPAAGNPPVVISVKEGHDHVDKPVKEISLWKEYEENGHFWNLSIDLNSCIGCSACVISCQAENNVPVVGKDEVRRGREMHWMRIDRYYSSDAKKRDYKNLEIPSDNPQVVYQPVMCQHCNHAPCETVCPVIATSHSTDGLNQMTYNRCVGTRYCANNCPYKVRRFNWFKYSDNEQFDFNMNDDFGKMVLNPDVVVRSRGVMEKCSMCVQRIQEGKLSAKKENRKMNDGEIQPACAQSCPTKAISFGDINDEKSKISKLKKDERSYHLLEEVGIKPNVFYLTKIRNV
jgi:MoCo/4Fe-4S cofactor protein with predicted Tat translocation signal